MKLTVLGNASPYPRPDQPCSGYLVETDRAAILLDAGPGTLAQLQTIRPIWSLDAIWISHRHVDHSADLLSAYYALRYGPQEPHAVPLYAPDGLAERIAAFVGPHAEEKVASTFPLTVLHGFGDTVLGDMSVSWAPVQHGVPAFGFRVESAGRSLAYSGDCAPCVSLVELAEGADVLVCEAGYSVEESTSPVHHTPEQAGNTAAQARSRSLLLTHLSDGLDPKDALSRASVGFDGPIQVLMPRSEYLV